MKRARPPPKLCSVLILPGCSGTLSGRPPSPPHQHAHITTEPPTEALQGTVWIKHKRMNHSLFITPATTIWSSSRSKQVRRRFPSTASLVAGTMEEIPAQTSRDVPGRRRWEGVKCLSDLQELRPMGHLGNTQADNNRELLDFPPGDLHPSLPSRGSLIVCFEETVLWSP